MVAIKKQIGVALSEKFLEERGDGTYGRTIRARRLKDLKYRPIRRSYFDLVVAKNECLRCLGPLIKGGNRVTGGTFYKCKDRGHECYNIGHTSELIVTPKLKVVP
jgi:hypothetical protein